LSLYGKKCPLEAKRWKRCLTDDSEMICRQGEVKVLFLCLLHLKRANHLKRWDAKPLA